MPGKDSVPHLQSDICATHATLPSRPSFRHPPIAVLCLAGVATLPMKRRLITLAQRTASGRMKEEKSSFFYFYFYFYLILRNYCRRDFLLIWQVKTKMETSSS